MLRKMIVFGIFVFLVFLIAPLSSSARFAGYTISGTISKSDGTVLQGVQVSSTEVSSLTVLTDVYGKFTLNLDTQASKIIYSGTLSENFSNETLTVFRNLYWNNAPSINNLQYVFDSNTNRNSSTLGGISGTVYGASTEDTGITISIQDSVGNQWYDTLWSGNQYSIAGIPIGSYSMDANTTSVGLPVIYENSDIEAGIMTVKDLQFLHSIRGTVSNVDSTGVMSPSSNATVSLQGHNPVQTDANGYYEFNYLVPGNYQLSFTQTAQNGTTYTQNQQVQLSSFKTVNILLGGININKVVKLWNSHIPHDYDGDGNIDLNDLRFLLSCIQPLSP